MALVSNFTAPILNFIKQENVRLIDVSKAIRVIDWLAVPIHSNFCASQTSRPFKLLEIHLQRI